MKLAFVIGIALVAVLAWTSRSASTSAPAHGAAARAAPARLTPEQFDAEVRKNTPVRLQLAKQYPDVYRDLALQTKQRLHRCIVTKVVDGVLKAVCR